MGLLDSIIESNHIRLSRAAIFTAADDPDRDDNFNKGFRRLTKTQHERDLQPLERSRQTEIARALTTPQLLEGTPRGVLLDIRTRTSGRRWNVALLWWS
jgi:hypothetical protein